MLPDSTIRADMARTLQGLTHVLSGSRQGFQVRRVPAAAADQWAMIDGALQHRSRGFFSVNGVVSDAGERVLLYQPQAAVTGVVTARLGGERLFLLQARAEPGCLGEAQFGPTVQSTPANFMRLHGGTVTPYIDAFIAFNPAVSIIDDTTQLDLGERYLCKTKRSILVEMPEPTCAGEAFVWASLDALYEAMGQSAFLNIDLRSILAVGAWSSDPDAGELSPRSQRIRQSLRAPLRADVFGKLMALLANASLPPTFKPLNALVNWQESEWGWFEREPRQGFSIEFYDVSAPQREVQRWLQPLVNSGSEGAVVLAARERAGVLEFYVRAVAETGFSSRRAIAPSYVRYPGAADERPDWLSAPAARVLSSTTESDEGGRFYRDVSRYEIVEVDGDAPPYDEGVWLRLAELKLVLRTSNLCMIQLRGVTSQLLVAP